MRVKHLVAVALMASACGSSNTTSPTPAPCQPTGGTPTITIVNNAVCPQNISVPAGSQVLFVNQDTIQHAIYSDPHPEHTDCPEINQVGYLDPGQSRLTGNLNTVRTCGFHDHIHPDVAALRGQIVIH